MPHDFAKRVLTASDGDVDLARSLVSLFLEELPPLLASAQEAVAAGDVAGLQHAAHTLKGSAVTLGFLQVADSALRLEAHARTGTLDASDAARDVAGLALACHEADRAARAYLGEAHEDSRR